MECNKDEAIRAKSIAEKKLADKDYNGAKKFTLKAQTLYPGLDGISQMLTTLDVYISSENKISGEVDWYGILSVKPTDDDETIRKSYRKLALMLHPDKNKSVGADGAFKLLSEAWSLLSDKSKRLAYNQRRSTRVKNPPPPNGKIHKQQPPNNSRNTVVPPPPPPPVVRHRSDTFWTICHRCKMHYEYLNLYLNHTLLCPNCQEPFLAKEMPPPGSQPSSDKSNSRTNVDPSIALKAASVVKQANDRLKREREEEFHSGWPAKKRKDDDVAQSSSSSGVKIPFQMSFLGSRKMNHMNRTRELTTLELRYILVHKAQIEIRKKLTELDSSDKSTKVNTESENKKPVTNDGMNVPDPDFHDFDLDRTEHSFQDNEVWAAYDDDDGMPRFYALIHKVISRDPLKMKISWLNSKTTVEFGSLDWLGRGFRKICGEFRIGRHELYKNLNSFSQKVEWTKAKGIIYILPKKGQVWALYRNWSADWDENVPEDLIHKYDMVEVVQDYNQEIGVTVAPLFKYPGFRTVFRRQEIEQVKVIPKEEMFRFSHQVPKYVLTGEEGDNCPKGCLELDPAATPFDLIAETNGEEKK